MASSPAASPRAVDVTALEPGSGKSAVVLGLLDVLARRVGRDAVLERVLDGFSAVSAGADVAVVEGSDLTGSAAAEVDLIAAAAVHLGASVLLVGGWARAVVPPGARRRAPGSRRASPSGAANLLGVVCNRVGPAAVGEVRSGLAAVTDGLACGVLPEETTRSCCADSTSPAPPGPLRLHR